MKKILGRIIGIVSILILGYQQFCYADVIVYNPRDDIKEVVFFIGFIVISILLISAISYFSLKLTIKKYSTSEFSNEKIKTISLDEIEKERNKIQTISYVCGIILGITILIYLTLFEEIFSIIFYIPMILFLISFIMRLNKKKKESNIICIISIVFVFLIGAWVGISNKIIDDYNKQFLQYKKDLKSLESPSSVSDMEELINTAIKNNKNGRKTTIIYQNISYTSPEELKQLLSKLNSDIRYSWDLGYDNNYDYIESITITSYINTVFKSLQQYEGNNKTGNMVKSLITKTKNIVIDRNIFNRDELKANIIYISETGKTINININSNSFENITNLKQEIKANKTYNVEFHMDSNEVYNIIITSNN